MWRVSVLFLILLASGCGGGPAEVPPASTMAAPTDTPAPTVAPASPAAEPAGFPTGSPADADVTFVRAVDQGESWTFHVTVAHADTGWEDYADGWDVVLPDGTVLKPDPESPFTRLLLHPHVEEQPFTRSQRGILIPGDVTTIIVRAHDLVDGFGGQEVKVDLSQPEGENFVVER